MTTTPYRDRNAVLDLSLRASFVSAAFQAAYVCAVVGDDVQAAEHWQQGMERLARLWAKAQAEQEGG